MKPLIDLATNTNRWGVPSSVVAPFADCSARLWSYPEPFADGLRTRLASYVGARAAEITTGCGSDGVLSAAIRASTCAGDRIAIPAPTFPMIADFSRAHGLDVREVPLTSTYDPDVDAMLACQPRIAYVCAPNNPTGTPVAPEVIVALARRVELLIVDQAYAEFDPESAPPRVRDRVLWVRTMSKAFGLAGARVGYGVGPERIIEAIEAVRGPYAVSEAGAVAATNALRRDRSWMRECAELAMRSRDLLTTALEERGLAPVRSRTNFVLVPMRDASAVARGMREAGVLVRLFTDLPRVSPQLAASRGAAVRISVGPWPEMETALHALDGARKSVACA